MGNEEHLKMIERIKEECRDLIVKVNKLHAFKGTETFYKLDRESKDLLYEQSRLMDKYIQILGKRMEILKVTDFIKGNKFIYAPTELKGQCKKCVGVGYANESLEESYLVKQHNLSMPECK